MRIVNILHYWEQIRFKDYQKFRNACIKLCKKAKRDVLFTWHLVIHPAGTAWR